MDWGNGELLAREGGSGREVGENKGGRKGETGWEYGFETEG